MDHAASLKHAYLILTTTFPGRSVHSPVTCKRRSAQVREWVRSSGFGFGRMSHIIWHSAHL